MKKQKKIVKSHTFYKLCHATVQTNVMLFMGTGLTKGTQSPAPKVEDKTYHHYTSKAASTVEKRKLQSPLAFLLPSVCVFTLWLKTENSADCRFIVILD